MLYKHTNMGRAIKEGPVSMFYSLYSWFSSSLFTFYRRDISGILGSICWMCFVLRVDESLSDCSVLQVSTSPLHSTGAEMSNSSNKKDSFYIAQYPVPLKVLSLFPLPDIPVRSDTKSASPWSILARQHIRATTKPLTFPPLSIAMLWPTHLYCCVNWASMERTKMPNLRNGSKGGFTWLRVRHYTKVTYNRGRLPLSSTLQLLHSIELPVQRFFFTCDDQVHILFLFCGNIVHCQNT